jgi:hypothetical protein
MVLGTSSTAAKLKGGKPARADAECADAECAALAGINVELPHEFARFGEFHDFAGVGRIAFEGDVAPL